MNYQQLYEKIDSLKEKFLNVLIESCEIESPTAFKQGVDRVGDYFCALARENGWQTEVCEQKASGNCICITMNPNASGKPIALSGHMDTVHPVGSFKSITVEGDTLTAPGCFDCKGGIVTALHAMQALQDMGYNERPVLLLLQSDEENSSITSNKETVKFMAEKAKNCAAFLNCEGSTGKGIVVQRKGIIRYVFEVHGKAVHSSHCYKGKNAVLEAAHKIIELEKWKDEQGITCNCGVINGGSVANTVAGSCVFIADIRYATSLQLQEVQDRVQKIADTSYIGGTSCTLTVKSQRIPMERSERNIRLFERINDICQSHGLGEREAIFRYGGSDAADISDYGIPCVDNMGIRGDGAHQDSELVYISSLTDTAKMLATLICEL